MNHYYVYYRVGQKDAAETEQLVRTMQARLACRCGILGRLLKKRDEPGLWMEVYEGVNDPERFEHLLREFVDTLDLDMFTETPRKLECFIGDTEEDAGGVDLRSASCRPPSPRLRRN